MSTSRPITGSRAPSAAARVRFRPSDESVGKSLGSSAKRDSEAVPRDLFFPAETGINAGVIGVTVAMGGEGAGVGTNGAVAIGVEGRGVSGTLTPSPREAVWLVRGWTTGGRRSLS